MPTGRAYTFLVAAALLYLFANQTQVGWLYVMSALLFGVVVTAFFLNRASIRKVQGKRTLNGQPLIEAYEGDTAEIAFTLQNQRRIPAVHLAATEICPLAPPDQRETSLFIPVLPSQEAIQFDYTTEIYQRGVYKFPPVRLKSRAPFGLFQKRSQLVVQTPALILPEVRPLRRFAALDRQVAAQMTYPRAGIGSEVIGVRPYQPGDSPRHIHWRSVARTGQLVSKEFAEETRPGLTLLLDRYFTQPRPDKHNAFEWAIKCAVSIAGYARSRNYPLYLLADTEDMPTPAGAVSWDGLLQYMARVQPTDTPRLSDLLNGTNLQSFIVAVIPQMDSTYIEPLNALKHRGYNVVAVVMQLETFPTHQDNSPKDGVPNPLQFNKTDIEAVTISYGSDWVAQLANLPLNETVPVN